jgi:hypothetical protein
LWPKSNCKGCERREVGCHIDCPDYIRFRKEVDELNEARKRIHTQEFWKVEDIPLKKESRHQTRRLAVDYS